MLHPLLAMSNDLGIDRFEFELEIVVIFGRLRHGGLNRGGLTAKDAKDAKEEDFGTADERR